jgi:uncharacterized protein
LKFTREIPAAVTIRRVSEETVVIGDQVFSETIALTPGGIVDGFSPPPVSRLSESHFNSLLAGDPELIVLGTGTTLVFPPRELTFAFARRSVGLEVMDTAAAARTFNVLAGEGRHVAAVLYV